MVQFARHAHNARKTFAIKFYVDRATFSAEYAQFTNPALHHILPAIDEIVPNADGELCVLGRCATPLLSLTSKWLWDWIGVDALQAATRLDWCKYKI